MIDDDWPAMANDNLGQRTGALKRQLTEAVRNLEPATPTQEKLWSNILADIDALSDYRIARLNSALAAPPVYVYVIIFGFLVTMACFGTYRPQGALVVLVLLYTVFVGLVLYLVLVLSDPFQGDIGILRKPGWAFWFTLWSVFSCGRKAAQLSSTMSHASYSPRRCSFIGPIAV